MSLPLFVSRIQLTPPLFRSFCRKWTLPEDVDLAAVRSQLTDKGHLQIEAPKTGASSARPIPIERR